MTIIKYILISIFMLFIHHLQAQTINWKTLHKEQRHIITVNTGIAYSFRFGAAYSYQLKTKWPLVLNAEYSFPLGNQLTDDFKTKIGGQIRWFKTGTFYISSQLQSIFRRYENSYARLLNFGTDISTTGGYYKKHWFTAAEIGFDKAIVTHFKHSAQYKINFPLVKDGWYEPSTGGNFYYGIYGGYSFHQADIYLKAGRLIQQDFKTSSMLPFYSELGLNLRFNKKHR